LIKIREGDKAFTSQSPHDARNGAHACRVAATGPSNDDIAKALVVSPALIKLGARDRAQLVVFADQSGVPVPTLVRPQHPWSYVENESGHPQGTRQRVRHFRARMAAKIASSGDRGHPRGYVSRALRRPA